LRAFIAAWSALELLINRLARVYQADFAAILKTGTVLPAWEKDLKDLAPEKYRMRDRFFCVACVSIWVLRLPMRESSPR
jgi:hypothetical protein